MAHFSGFGWSSIALLCGRSIASLYVLAQYRRGVPKAEFQTWATRPSTYVAGDVHTNTVESAFSLVKRGIVGTWHKVSAKHLHAYLNEMCYRFNNRKNPYLFRDVILKIIETKNLEYKELTAKISEPAA